MNILNLSNTHATLHSGIRSTFISLTAGARGQDMITDAEKDAALHSERPVSKIKLKDGTPELVEEIPRNSMFKVDTRHEPL